MLFPVGGVKTAGREGKNGRFPERTNQDAAFGQAWQFNQAKEAFRGRTSWNTNLAVMHLDIALPPNTFARRKEDLMG